jgi:hypothetical protein
MHPVSLRIDTDREGRALDDGCEKWGFDAEVLLSLSIHLEQSRPEVLQNAGHAPLLFGQCRATVRPDDNALIAIGDNGPTISARRYARSNGKHLTGDTGGDCPRGYCYPDPAADFTQPPVGCPGGCRTEN